MKAGSMLIDSSTIDPVVSRELANEAKAKGISFIDAPVSGGVKGAADGTLTFMVGAETPEVHNNAVPVLQTMGMYL